MDLLSLCPLPSLLICTSLALIFLFSFLYKHKSPRPNLPPGKTGWPIIGETLQLLLLWRKGHPENFVRERRNKYSSNIFQTSLFGENMVFFCGPAANKFLFSNESKLVATWWPSTFNKLFHSNSSFTSSTSTGVKTKSVRDVVSGFLKMDVLQNYVSTIDSIAREHIEKEWEPKEGKVVVVEAVKKYTLVLACQLLVGIKDHEHWVGFGERFASVLAGIVSVPIDFPGTTFSKAIKDAQFLRKELVVIIRERKTRLKKEENPTVHDLLSGILLTLDANGKFRTEEDTADQIMGLLIAGHETASVALTFTIKYLAELPHVYQEVFKGTTFSKAIKDARFLRKELVVIIKERKTMLEKEENPTIHDLLSGILLTLDANGKFRTEEDTADQIMGLLIAGHETASVALTFMIKYLAELPHVYQGVFKEIMEIAKAKGPGELLNWGDIKKMSYTWNVACEAMRLAPPAQMGFKEALSDFTFDGFTIPKGWKACWSVHSTNKDPDYFPNPEEFDPTRFEGNGPAPYTYVPFGGGHRICPGREYARLEILVFIYNLVKKFEWKKLVPNERMTFNPSPSPENGLPICLKPHDTSST